MAKKRIYLKGEGPIIIRGVELTCRQSMTVRVALESFMTYLIENGLGEHENGKKTTQAYLKNINDIRCLIFDV